MPIYPNPTPSFFPIIGSGFGDIANQQFNFARTNLDTQTQNFARAAAAEQARNNWLRQLADLQRGDQATQESSIERQVNRDMAGEATDYARQTAAQQAAEDRRRFDIQTQLQEKQIEKTKAAEQEQLDTVASAGEELAPQLADVAQKYQSARKDYTDAIAKVDTAAADIAAKSPTNDQGIALIKYVPKSRIFEATLPGNPDSQKAAVQANIELSDHTSAFKAAKAEHDNLAMQLRDMEKTLAGYGLIQGSDYSVFSPRHKKRWGGIKTVDALPPPPAPDLGPSLSPNFGMPQFGGGGYGEVPAGPSFFSAPNPVAPMRIGRFTVTPSG